MINLLILSEDGTLIRPASANESSSTDQMLLPGVEEAIDHPVRRSCVEDGYRF
jgi:hypothetical protein